MKLSKWLEIFNQKKRGWIFRRENIEGRLLALNGILELGSQDTIWYLIPSLRDANKEIQTKTCNVIIELFRKIEAKRDYNGSVRYFEISVSDIDYYEQTFPKEQFVYLAAIASLNENGYVRERAVRSLAETNHKAAISFLIYRLADWVEPVRQSALQGIDKFKKKEFMDILLGNLETFSWLKRVQRVDLSDVYVDVMKFILGDNKQYVIGKFKSFKDGTRLLIAKYMADSEQIASDDLKLLLNDKYFLIRTLALNYFDQLNRTEVTMLLNDKSAYIRYATLYRLKDQSDFPEIVSAFLSDNSAKMREFARHSLKADISDFASLYHDNLLRKRDIIGSIIGLAETNGSQFVGSIEPFLNDNIIKVRKAAFLALRKLDKEKSYNFAFQNLDSVHVGIRNIAIDHLAILSTPEVLQKAREIYETNQFELKESMLKLFSKIGKWATISDLMIGTIDENEDIRQISLNYVKQWRIKAPAYFVKPKKGELERANYIFKQAFKVHEEKKYFHVNPLEGIDFYLR